MQDRPLSLSLEIIRLYDVQMRLMFHVFRMLTGAAYVRPSEWQEQATSVENNRNHIALQAFSLIILQLVQTSPLFLSKIASRFNRRDMQGLLVSSASILTKNAREHHSLLLSHLQAKTRRRAIEIGSLQRRLTTCE